MGSTLEPPRRPFIASIALGILLGALLAFGTSLVFLMIIFGPLLGLGLTIGGLRSGLDGRSPANAGAGLLIGMGSVYLIEAVNTFNSCNGENDVCGDARALPFLGFAAVVLALGLLAVGITFARGR